MAIQAGLKMAVGLANYLVIRRVALWGVPLVAQMAERKATTKAEM